MSTDAAAAELANLLMTGAIKPGQFLSIREVSELVGAPIGNAREAVQQLSQAGFLSVYPNRGVQVAEITPRHIRNVFSFREIIEAHALRSFVRTASEDEIDRLIETQREARKALDGMDDQAQLRTMIVVNEVIHIAIVDALDNALVSKSFKTILQHINWMRANRRISSRRHAEVIEEHIGILNACRNRDAEAAVALASQHLETALRLTLYS